MAATPGTFIGDNRVPLVVDLDGTLSAVDTLYELFLRVVRRRPLILLSLPFWLLRGRAVLKARLVEHGQIDPQVLPFRDDLCDLIRDERARGRRIILATAADRAVADAVASHLGFFDDVLASDGRSNLKGVTKLDAIVEMVGPEFIYAGDSSADLPIWRKATGAIVVAARPSVSKAARAQTRVVLELAPVGSGLRLWLRQLRVYQWLKNMLVFVPMLTAFAFGADQVARGIAAFFAFSLVASGTYILNDLWDLESDRAHPRKRLRPLASGEISVPAAVVAAAGLIGLSLVVAVAVGGAFTALLLTYLLLSSLYSWVFKSIVLFDVVVLSALYAIRIVAGAAAVRIPTSVWLLAFSVFMFLSLALIKRCTELVTLSRAGQETAKGRDYRTSDLAVLWPLGVGSGLCAVVVFSLFISAPATTVRYATPQLLWLVGIELICWLGLLWITTARGEMHDDPIVYALRHRASLMLVASMLLTVLAAHFIRIDLAGIG